MVLLTTSLPYYLTTLLLYFLTTLPPHYFTEVLLRRFEEQSCEVAEMQLRFSEMQRDETQLAGRSAALQARITPPFSPSDKCRKYQCDTVR